MLFCAAGVRYPMEAIVNEYAQRYGVAIEVQYGGSNTLLNQLEVARTGDLYLAADESFMRLAREKGLLDEVIPLARQTPVMAVPRKIPNTSTLSTTCSATTSPSFWRIRKGRRSAR